MLKKGEILAFKTDTVWGFGANPEDKDAVFKIYEIKKRDEKKPLILMSDDINNLKKYIKKIPDYAQKLIEKYLPGALTLIFEKSDLCPFYITSNQNTVGIRIPNSPDFFHALNYTKNRVLATTSCNVSGDDPVKNYKEALEKFSFCATIVKPISVDENSNLPSTVILCKNDDYKVIRKGVIKL